jgi:hypothetical protein
VIKFKVGDKVRRVSGFLWDHSFEEVYTVTEIREDQRDLTFDKTPGEWWNSHYFYPFDQSEAVTKPSNPKDVIGSTKPPLHHIPCGPLFQIGGALLSGACKYGAHNWRVVGVRSDVYYDAMLRHVMQWWEGEEIDKESGMPHLAHAAACCVILLDAEAQNKLTDNRPPKGNNPSEAVADQIKAILANYPNPVEPFTELSPPR